MSRKVVLVSDEQTLEGMTATVKVDPESGVGTSDAVIKSEIDAEIIVDKENSEMKSEPNEYHSGNVVSYADDEEDVPSDFFDDFSNQDFMAGLDIVDAWDEEELIDKEKAKNMNESRDLQQKGRRRRSEKEKRRYKHSPIRYNDKKSRRSRDKSRSSRERDRRRRSKDNKSKEQPKESKECETDEQISDHRRDPEKTKRDIQKDKDKCAKNKEAKIISEKLKVVETGLVPPGMEMEVDLKQLKSSMPIKEQEKKSGSTREERSGIREERSGIHEERSGIREERRSGREERNNIREERFTYDRRRRSRSISIEMLRSRYMMREKRYSPLRRMSRSPRSRDRSYEHRLRLRSRSPYRGRSRSKSPYHDRDRRRLSSERRFYIEERKRTRRYRDTSPTVLRRKSRNRSLELSPVSNISEREMWLRQREHKRERKISSSVSDAINSLSRKRSHNFLEELANKLNNTDKKQKSLLKEIQDKLNEPSQPEPIYSMAPVPAPISNMNNPGQMSGFHPVPGPGFMPGPSHPFFPQPDPAPQYDQQFFIGQPDIFHNPNPYISPFMDPGHIPAAPVVPPGTMVPHPVNSPLHSNFNSSMQNNVDLLKAQKAVKAQKEKDQETITKLFEDKKISLSDFLSMSAKRADPTKPVNVQKKIKVISLCQDAIKALGGDSKLSGRFFLKKIFKEAEKKEDMKFQSPMRKIPIVRFRFTTPSKGGGEERSSLQSTLSKLLASLGVTEASKATTPKPSLSPVSSEASVKSVPLKKTVPAKTPPPRKYDPILGAKFQMKMCQTDPVKCNICEIRKARKLVEQGVQCAIKTVDSGTQMSDDELQRMGYKVPMKDALKNQSLAHLTPAQILAAQAGGQEESPKKDSIFPASRMMTPPPPEISPDKQNARVNLSNNDNFLSRSEYVDRFKTDHFNAQSNVGRSAGFKLPSIFDKIIPNPFEGMNRSRNSFDGNPKLPSLFDRPNFDNGPIQQMPQGKDSRFRGNTGFNQRMMDEELDFEPPPNTYGVNSNPRSLPTIRGNFLPGPYGGRKFF